MDKNVIIAVSLCIGIWLGFDLLLRPSDPAHQENQIQAPLSGNSSGKPLQTEKILRKASLEKAFALQPRQKVLASSQRIGFENKVLKGSVEKKGLFFNDLILKEYKEADETPVVLLAPLNTLGGCSVRFSWYGADKNLDLPTEESVWTAKSDSWTGAEVSAPMTFSWVNSQGMLFQQTFAMDKAYMLTVRQYVRNTLKVPVTLGVQSVIQRRSPVAVSGYSAIHEGPLGIFSKRLENFSYEDPKGFSGSLGSNIQGAGWLGMTDKYWLTAVIPEAQQMADGQVFPFQKEDLFHVVQSRSEPFVVQPGEELVLTTRFFSGPKKLSLLDAYEKKYHIHHFDLAVDFGWFYLITKPMFYLLVFLRDLSGSFGMALLLMTVLFKILFYPLSAKSYRSAAITKALQPKINQIKERYKDDKVRQGQELMALYKTEKINPVSGCLPMIIQIPVFFALYKVLFISLEMRQASFWWWINDLSSPDPTTLFNLFGLLPFGVPEFLHIGAWPLLMAGSMVLQQWVSGTPVQDETQKILFRYVMPLSFCYMTARFPVGLVIYWTWSNVLTMAQQWIIMEKVQRKKT